MKEKNSKENEEFYKIMFQQISKNNKIERNQIKNKLNKDIDPILFAYSSNDENKNINNNIKNNDFNNNNINNNYPIKNQRSKLYEEYLIRTSQRKERPHLNTQNKKNDTFKLSDVVNNNDVLPQNLKRCNLRLKQEEKAHQIKPQSKRILNPNLSNNINEIFNKNNDIQQNNNNNKSYSKRIFRHNNTSFDTLFSGQLKISNKKHFFDRNKDSIANELIYQS